MLRLRVITALVLLGLLLLALYFGRLSFTLAAAVIFGGAVFEWLRLAGVARGTGLFAAVALMAVLVAVEAVGRSPSGALLTTVCGVAAVVWLALGALVVRSREHGGRLPNAPVMVVGLVVLPAAWCALLALHARGVLLLFSALAIVWIADIAAYFAGRAFGRSKLAPGISPGKTWAGVWGAASGVLAVATLAYVVVPDAPLFTNLLFSRSVASAVVLLVLLVAISIVGDLFESLLKRQAGMKDSGTMLPGHGGILDRIDAMLPVLPVAVLIEQWIR